MDLIFGGLASEHLLWGLREVHQDSPPTLASPDPPALSLKLWGYSHPLWTPREAFILREAYPLHFFFFPTHKHLVMFLGI